MHLGVLEGPLLGHLVGPKLVPAVNQGHFSGELGEEDPLLHGGVPPTHHDHLLVPVEEAVAGGAGGNPPAVKLVLPGDPKPPRVRPRGHDHRPGAVVPLVAPDQVAPLGLLQAQDLVHDDPGPELLRLPHHAARELRPGDALGEARVVLHLVRLGDLPPGKPLLHDDRLELGPAGVDPGGKPRGPPADDDHIVGFLRGGGAP